MYYLSGCGAYKFVIDFDSIITVYASSLEITHPKTAKKHQLRGVRRLLAKQHIKYLRPTNWRDKLLIKQSKHLKALGNDQGVVSKDAARRIKFEQVRSIDRDADSHIDICKMYLDKNWRTYIQKVALPQEIYLISKRPIEILQAKNFALLKLSHNTLFFDATGSIMRKYEPESKRVFLYSLVAHLDAGPKKRGTLLPVAEGFLCSHYANCVARFLMSLETFCAANKLKWPICKRVCTDWSTVLINAILKAWNCVTLEGYIDQCFYLCKKNEYPKFIVIQLCCAHFIRIVEKDIKAFQKDEEIASFYKLQVWKAINISKIDDFFIWLRCFLVVLLSPTETDDVIYSIDNLKNFVDGEPYKNWEEEHMSVATSVFPSTYKNSPFFYEGSKLFQEVKSEVKSATKTNSFYSEEFANVILKKYVPYTPLWTNIVGVFVDNINTRISNSPVEGYFNIKKNITLDGRRNIKPADYVRLSINYMQARLVEAEDALSTLISDTSEPVAFNLKMEEETWKRTPKKVQSQITSQMKLEKILSTFKNLPRKFDKRYIALKFQNVHSSVQSELIDAPTIDFIELESLNKKKELYSNLIDIYIEILIKNSAKNAFSTCCEIGRDIFIAQNSNIQIPLQNFDILLIPVFEPGHFTLVYVDTVDKTFSYLNPLGEDFSDVEKFLKTFKKHTNALEYKPKQIKHGRQKDNFNCGIYVCQFAEAILNKKNLEDIEDPNIYRGLIKKVLLESADDMTKVCLHCGTYCDENLCKSCDRPICGGCFRFYYKNEDNFETCQFCSAATSKY